MKGVTNYLKNITKSIAYSAADITKSDLTPNAGEFIETNKQFFVDTYATIRNPKSTQKKLVNSITESKYYTAIDYGAKNLFEDLRTGNFYNKEREDKDNIKFAGSAFNIDSLDDLSEFGIDADWEKNLDGGGVTDEVTSGDIKIADAIEGSAKASSNATAKVIASVADVSVKNSRVNVGILYNQNEKLFGGLHTDISILNSTMDSILKITAQALPNMDKNTAEYFTEANKLNKENNAILKEMLEIQRNVYKSAADKEKDEINKKKNNKKKRWQDINYGGIPDFGEYIGLVKENIKKETSAYTGMMDIMGEDSNMLAMDMASPLKAVTNTIVKGIIPATVKVATKELDNTLSSVFGTIMGSLANKKNDYDSGVLGTIAKFLGVDTTVKRKIDSSKYEKGAIPFDGLTRKAIIDVIPTYLRRIEAALTGKEESLYDFDTGKWIKSSKVKEDYNKIKKNSIMNGTYKLRSAMNNKFSKMKYADKSEQENFDKAIQEFWEYLYENNGIFNPKKDADANNINAYNYSNLYNFYDVIRDTFDNFDYVTDKKTGVKRHTKLSSKMISKDILSAKDDENRRYRNMEKLGVSAIGQYTNSETNRHGKFVKDNNNKEKFVANNMLLSTKDNLGNTIFTYLQKMTAELQWQRENGDGNISYGKRRDKRRGKIKATPKSNINNITSNLINPNMVHDQRRRNDREDRDKESYKKRIIKKISSGEAIDLQGFDNDERAYLLKLATLVSSGATDDYYKEVGENANSDIVSRWIDRNIFKVGIRSMDDIDEAIDKAQRSGKNTYDVKIIENGKDTTNSGVQKLLNKFNKGKDFLGGIMGASGEIFTNLLYTADRAIYDMMFKAEIKDDDNKKDYKGILDMIAGKTSDVFDKLSEKFKNDIWEPLKRRLGIDDEFTGRFKDRFKTMGAKVITTFANANKETYSPLFNRAQGYLDTGAYKRNRDKAEARSSKNSNSKIRKDVLDAMYKGDTSGIDSNADILQTTEERKKWLIDNGYISSKLAKERYKDEDIDKAYFRIMNRSHAAGTVSGIPFKGTSMLSKGEMLFNSRGVSVVNQTGAYNITEPTHILNSYDSNPILKKMGIDAGPRKTPAQDLQNENKIKDKLVNHNKGTFDPKKIARSFDSKEIKDTIKANVPEGLAGGAMGAIISTLLGFMGGPLVGAAVGYAGTILSQSESLKDKLFGKIEDGKRNGGTLFDKKMMDAVHKYVPDTLKGAMAGIIPGLITPLGPIGGLLAGGAVGFLKNNDSFMDKYFGVKDKLGNRIGGQLSLDPKTKKILQKMFPGAAKGAGIGALTGIMFGGPFGILGNSLLGAAGGVLTTTDAFKESIIGRIIRGKREGGITGLLEEAFAPLKDIGIDIKDRFFKLVDNKIVDPISRFLTPFIHEINDKANSLMNKLTKSFKENFTRPITTAISDHILKPIGGIAKKTVGPIFSRIGGLATLPFRALGKVGDHLKGKQIKQDRADYMTAEERINWMQRNGKGNKISDFDKALAGISSEDQINDAISLRDNLSALTDNKRKVESNRRSKTRQINTYLDSAEFTNGGKLTPKVKKQIAEAINDGADMRTIQGILTKSKLTNKQGLSKNELDNLLNLDDENGNSLSGLINEYGNLKTRSERAGKLKGEDKSEIFEQSKDILVKMGVDPNNIKNLKDLEKYRDLLNTEILNRQGNKSTTKSTIENPLTDELTKQTSALDTLVELATKILAGTDPKSAADIAKRHDISQQAIDNVANHHDDIDRYNKDILGDDYDTLSDDDKDRLRSQSGTIFKENKTIKNARKHKIKASQISAVIDSDVIDIVKKLNSYGYNFSNEIIEFMKGKLNSKTKTSNVKKFFKNKTIIKLFKDREITKGDINFAIRYSNDNRIINHIKEVLKSGMDVSGYSLKEINNISGSDIENYKLNNQNESTDNEPNDVDDVIESNAEDIGTNLTPIANNGIGTFLLNTASKGAKFLGKKAVSGTKKLGKKALKGAKNAIFANNSNTSEGAIDSIISRFGNNNTDEVDDPNDGKDIIVNPETGDSMRMKRESDGSVSPDTSDNKTKDVLNKLCIKQRMQDKLQQAQLKAAELTQQMLGEQKGEGGKKFKWWELLLAGLIAAPYVKKVLNSFIKPLWDGFVKPVGGSLLKRAGNFIIDKAIPAIGTLIGEGIHLLITSLPSIIIGAIKGVKNAAGSVLDEVVGNKNNAGASTTLDTEGHADDELSDITDSEGNKLTYGQIKSGEYNDNMYNSQGAKATVDDLGNIGFNDESKSGSSFMSKLKAGMVRSFIKGSPGKVLNFIDRVSGKLLARKGLISKAIGLTGKVVTKPLKFAANPLKSIVNGSDAVAKVTSKNGAKIVKIIEGCKGALQTLFGDTKVLKMLSKAADALGVKNVDTWISKLFTKMDDFFTKTIKKAAEKVEKSTLSQAFSKVAKVLGPIMVVADFLSGCDRAESILGISDTGIVEEVVAGIVNAICQYTIILTFFPGVGSIASAIIKLFEDDEEFEKRQQEADEEVAKYNEENGTTLSKEEYLEQNKSFIGKAKGFIKKIFVPKKIDYSNKNYNTKQTEDTNTENAPTVENNAYGTIPALALAGAGVQQTPFTSINNSITDLISQISSGVNTNNDDTINRAKSGEISVFSPDYWSGVVSTKQGLSGQMETTYNGLARIMQIPLIMISKIFGGFGNWINNLTGSIGDKYKSLSKFFTGDASNSSNQSTSGSSTSSSPNIGSDNTTTTNSTSSTGSSSSSGGGFFSKVWSGIKSIFGAGKYGLGYDKQNDPRIANLPFNAPGDTVPQTLGDSGCGPAAAVSAVKSAFGRGVNDIVNAAGYALNGGYKETNGGTRPEFFKDYFNENGLDSTISNNRDELADRIVSGQPTVLMGQDGRGVNTSNPFGDNPHYVTATGTDGNGNVIIQDPESEYDNQLYNIDDVLSKSTLGVSAYGKYGRSKFGRGKQLGSVDDWLNCCQQIAETMVAKGFKYQNSNGRSSWSGAQEVKNADCGRYVSYALQEFGALPSGKMIYSQGSSIKGSGAEDISKNAKIISCSGTSPLKNDLQPGDICCFTIHTNVFAGYNKQGEALWWDGGRSSTESHNVGSKYNNLHKKGDMSYYKTTHIIRLNFGSGSFSGISSSASEANNISNAGNVEGSTSTASNTAQTIKASTISSSYGNNSLSNTLGNSSIGKSLNSFTNLITGASALSYDTKSQSGMGKYGRGRKYGRSKSSNKSVFGKSRNIYKSTRPRISTFGKSKYGRGVQSDSNGLITNGTVINIPNGLGKVHTYMGWQLITSKSSTQYKLRDKAGQNFNSEGFGVINGRYVIACTSTFGKIGDYIDFYQEDGTVIPTVMGDEKSQSDSGCTKWGHDNGKCIIEFVVDKSSWYNCGHANPGNSGCHPEWNKNLTKAINGGNYFDDPSFKGAATAGDPSTTGGTTGDANTAANATTTHVAGLIDMLAGSSAGKALSSLTGLISGSSNNSTSNESSSNSDTGDSSSESSESTTPSTGESKYGRGKYGRGVKYNKPVNNEIKRVIPKKRALYGMAKAQTNDAVTNVANTTNNTTTNASSSGTTQKVGIYNLTDSQLKQLANLCTQEQGELDGTKAEATLMANRFEKYGKKFGSGSAGLCNYVRTSGWFHDAADFMDNGHADQKHIDGVKDVFVNGNRTIPLYVDEHDCFSDIGSISTGSVRTRSDYVKDKTIVKNHQGSTYTFYCFPTSNSDPFGYINTKVGDTSLADAVIDGGSIVNNSSSNSIANTATKSVSGLINMLSESKAGKALSSLTGLISGTTSESTDSSGDSGSSGSIGDSATANGDVASLLSVANNEVGYHEKNSSSNLDDKTASNDGSGNYTKYWRDISPSMQGEAWCARFVSWCARKAGISEDVIPNYAACSDGWSKITDHKDKKEVQPGDLLFVNKNGGMHHTGIVESVNGDKINTIEGNSDDKVARREKSMSESNIYFARPKYKTTSGGTTYTANSNDKAESGNDYNTRGGNNHKLLSKLGIYGKGKGKKETTIDRSGVYKTEDTSSVGLESVYNKYSNSISGKSKFGRATNQLSNLNSSNTVNNKTTNTNKATTNTSTNNNGLIKIIIEILYTIADNTDKLNTIVTLLNDKLGTNISTSEMSNNDSNKESVKSKLKKALLDQQNGQAIAQQFNGQDSSIASIINAMNVIATE